MILQELAQLYDRRRLLPDSDIAPPGWVRRPLDYVFVLETDGSCVNVMTNFELVKGKRVARAELLPAIGKQALKHTNSGKDANLLWDVASFATGFGDKKGSKLPSFASALGVLGDLNDPGLAALRAFVDKAISNAAIVVAVVDQFNLRDDFEARDPAVAFQLLGDSDRFVHSRPAVRAAYERSLEGDPTAVVRGHCLVSGETEVPLASNETVIKGVRDAQTAGANIVSFNAPAFASYGKRDRNGENAPVGARASFGYTTALNDLLAGERNRLQVGDASTVFWASRPGGEPSRFDSEFTLADLFGEPKPDNPDRGRQAVQALYESVHSGKGAVDEADTRFFVLGLAPNAARLSVRFWLPGVPFAELGPRLLQHFEDLKITPRYDSDPQTPSLFRLLSSIALQGKLDNVPPRLAGEWMRAILEGRPGPAALLNAAVMRCRAERDVTYLRAAILKAWVNRDWRRKHPEHSANHQYIKEALDMTQTDPAYRLGRLFATLERIQERAQPGINATIRDRYYGAASTTPVAVFTTLLRLKNAHLKKLPEAQVVFYEKLIAECLATPFDAIPRQLTLADQGLFALGYYQQRQAFFTKKTEPTAEESTTGEQP